MLNSPTFKIQHSPLNIHHFGFNPATRRPGDPATRRPGDPATRAAGGCYNLLVRKWWVWVLLSIFSAPALHSDPAGTIKGNAEVRAVLSHDYQIDVYVQPHDGDAWTRLA